MPSKSILPMIKQAARNLRKNQTPAEKIFWELVRKRRFKRLKFYRQHPIRFDYDNSTRYFIADFYCPEKKTIIELDGPIHERRIDYDRLRDYLLNELGFRVVRIKNEELADKIKVIERLKKELK